MPVSLKARSTEPELLDMDSCAEAAASLQDLRFVNRFLGGWPIIRAALAPFVRRGKMLRVLDVGCGSGDLAGRLVELGGGCVSVVGCDLKPAHLALAPTTIGRVVGDVKRLPFFDDAFDIVLCSLFLHHFDGDDAAFVLRSLYAKARLALVVSDLRRAHVPLAFGRLFFPLLFRSHVSVHDGLVSIQRAFTERELRDAFRAAGIPGALIRRRFPYRMLVVAQKAAS